MGRKFQGTRHDKTALGVLASMNLLNCAALDHNDTEQDTGKLSEGDSPRRHALTCPVRNEQMEKGQDHFRGERMEKG